MAGFVTLSNQGQIVIPTRIREELGLTAGSKFLVNVDRDGQLIYTYVGHTPPKLRAANPKRAKKRAA